MLYDNGSNSPWSNKHLFRRIEEMKEITMRAKGLKSKFRSWFTSHEIKLMAKERK